MTKVFLVKHLVMSPVGRMLKLPKKCYVIDILACKKKQKLTRYAMKRQEGKGNQYEFSLFFRLSKV